MVKETKDSQTFGQTLTKTRGGGVNCKVMLRHLAPCIASSPSRNLLENSTVKFRLRLPKLA